jgi:hypothetical protein
MFYVQYDEVGNITGKVLPSCGTAPDALRQLAFDSWIDVTGKMVDLDTLSLIDDPNYILEQDEPPDES